MAEIPLITTCHIETLDPTAALRFVVRDNPDGSSRTILQQEYCVLETGKTIWLDVPLVTE